METKEQILTRVKDEVAKENSDFKDWNYYYSSGLGMADSCINKIAIRYEQEVSRIEREKTEVQDIIDIIDQNYNEYTGSNEAVLHAAEDIVDLIRKNNTSPEIKKSHEVPESVGMFIIENAVGIRLNGGEYYHYAEVCYLLKKYKTT
jgi:hypothetical protein